MTGLRSEMVVRRGEFALDVSLDIDPGETVALLGPNGAGKSTAVMALAGLLPIDHGRIELDGVVLDDPAAGVFVAPEDRRIGVVFQDYLLFPHLTVAGNIGFGVPDRRTRAERSAGWMERLALSDVSDRHPAELSGGQAQRVALGRALASEPRLLLLDEPLSALDVATRTEVRRTLAEHLAAFPGPRLLITHDPSEAFLLADRMCVVEDGMLTQEGTAVDLRMRPRTRYAADLAGTNLIRGVALGGLIDTGGHLLHIADRGLEGPMIASIRPTSITIHVARPGGSPRNVWATTVEGIEPLGDRVRILTGSPLPLAVEITTEALDTLGLEPAGEVWVAVKATEIRVDPD